MLFVDKKYCTGCKLCEKHCPNGAIKVISGKANLDVDICNECYQCVYVCPRSAIKQTTKFIEKVTVSNEKDLSALSNALDDLQKKLSDIELRLNGVKNKRKQKIY
jgi:ferredoxin